MSLPPGGYFDASTGATDRSDPEPVRRSAYGAGPEDVLAAVDAQTQAAVERAHRATAFREAIDRLRGEGAQGAAEVVVDVTGMLLDIRFTRDTRDVDPDRLAQDVMAAVHRAQRAVEQRVSEQTRAVWGDDDPVTTRMESEMQARFEPRGPGRFLTDRADPR